MPRFSRIAAVLCAGVLAAAPASAAHTAAGEFVPEYVETPVYFHCNGDTKVSNLHATLDSNYVSWDTNKPTASYTSGAGCGTADSAVEGTADRNPIYDFTVAGFYTGNVDTLTLRLWAIEGFGRTANKMDMKVHVTIDGEDVLKRGTVANAVPIASSTGATRLYEVTITGVDLGRESDHSTEHEVLATVYPQFVNRTGGGIVWVYDAAEVDSGLVFNDTTPAATTIARNVPRTPEPAPAPAPSPAP